MQFLKNIQSIDNTQSIDLGIIPTEDMVVKLHFSPLGDGSDFYIGTDIEEFVFGSGVTMMFNFKNKSAIMVSYGLNFYQSPDRWLGSSERISYKFPNRLYLGIETLSSTTTWSYDGYDAEYFSVLGSDNSISVLFHLGFKLF